MRSPAATPRRLLATTATAALCLLGGTLATGAAAHTGSVAHAGSHHARPARHHARRATPVAKPADPVADGIGPCPDTNLMPTSSNVSLIVRSTLCLVNAQRRQAGLVPLVEDPRLDHSAQQYSDDMVSGGYFQHVSPSGSTPVDRMTSAGYLSGNVGYEVGENIAWGTLGLATPASIVTAWMNSPDHRANILRAAYRQTGLGITPGVPGGSPQGAAGATYTQDFGVITG